MTIFFNPNLHRGRCPRSVINIVYPKPPSRTKSAINDNILYPKPPSRTKSAISDLNSLPQTSIADKPLLPAKSAIGGFYLTYNNRHQWYTVNLI
ncbi:hypothetical protein BLOT_012382 [Blomia tropicalis]|nr:hypothetical protein BLOT_012382 [Blomia tropicalis]